MTSDLFNKQISLLVNRDGNGHAQGSLFLDTGLTLAEIDTSNN